MQTQRYFRSSLLSTWTGNTSAFARYPLQNSNAKFPANLNGGTNIWRYISTLYNLGVVPYNVSLGTLVMSKLLSRLSLKDRVFTVLVTSSNPSSSWLLKMSIRLLRNEKGTWAHMCPAIALMYVYVTQANFTTKPRFEIKNKRSFTEMNSQGSRVEKNTHAQKVQMQKILFTNEACWWNLLVWRNHA